MILRKKRQDPYTPQVREEGKKQREYQSPLINNLPHTPLRNAMIKHSSIAPSPLNPSSIRNFDNDNEGNKITNNNQKFDSMNKRDQKEDVEIRGIALRKKKEQKKSSILSPVIGNSPKAALPKKLLMNPNGNNISSKSISMDKVASPRTNLRFLNTSEAPKMTIEQMSETFERWMKIAINHKIDPKDTWNLALIDYFSELTFLREGNSINFQKASCTLDGCVKIYSMRVDSIADETGKLLNGFISNSENSLNEKNSNMKKSKKHNQKDEDDKLEQDSEIDDPLAMEEDGIQIKKSLKKKNLANHGSTLEKSFDAITMKSFENTLSIDPLFKKISSDFDESSVHGALLSSLPITCHGRILLDSSISTLNDDEDEEELKRGKENKNTNQSVQIDIRKLKDKFEGSLREIGGKTICPTLNSLNLQELNMNMNSIVKDALNRLDKLTLNNHESLLTIKNDLDNIEDDDDDNLDFNNFHNDGLMMEDGFDERRNDNIMMEDYNKDDVISHYNQQHFQDDIEYSKDGDEMEDDDGESSYTTTFAINRKNNENNNKWSNFDNLLQRNWAGPDHWKIKRLGGGVFGQKINNNNNSNDPDYKKSSKKEFFLDFFTTEVDFDGIYARSTNPALLSLSRQALEERHASYNLLPEDLQFTSKKFLSLFTKSNWTIGNRINKMIQKKKKIVMNQFSSFQENQTCNQDQQNEQDQDIPKDYWNNINVSAIINDELNPISPTCNSLNYSDSDFDHDEFKMNKREENIQKEKNANGDEDEDSTAIISSLSLKNINSSNLIQPIKSTIQNANPLSFARRSKHVNVQKLKDVIWSELMPRTMKKMENTQQGNEKKEMDKDHPSKEEKIDTFSSSLFSKIIDNIGNTDNDRKSNYPLDEIKNVSTSFCFICLLHLANEHGLHLENTLNGDIKIQN